MNHRGFGSDNWASVHPAVMEALAACNQGHAIAYGDDPYTAEAQNAFDALFGRKVYTHFVWNGTGANAAVLSHLTQRFGAILCTDVAHINCDECGAVEHMTGNKVIGFEAPDGKLKPDMLRGVCADIGSQHRPQPGVVSITQSTEWGTVYTPDEVKAIADFAHENGMKVHMDGARLANAAAALGVPVAAYTCDAGVDALCFGGTKNGLMSGEAVIFFDEALSRTFPMTRKNCGQLASKNRYIAAQFTAVLKDDIWLQNGRHANAMAGVLHEGLAKLPGVSIVQPVAANEVFLRMPDAMLTAVETEFVMHDVAPGIYRLVCSFDTQRDEIDRFIALAARA